MSSISLVAMLKKKPLPPHHQSVSPSTSHNGDITDGSCEENVVESVHQGILATSKDYEITDSGNSNMKVVVRIRPENEVEIRSNCETVVKALDDHVLVFDPKEDNHPQFERPDVVRKRRPFLSKKHKDLRFAFDRVFDETSTQKDVFENTTKTIIDGLLDGINCSVFAYGATGAGKTHTMLGTSEKPGVMFLTTMELYRRIEQLKHEKTCEIAVTYLEVYNETIRDLLIPSGPLAMREDGHKGLVVAGLSQHQPKSAEDLLQMLENGNKNRTQHPTDANATSSRSHAVFQVYVNQKSRTAGLSTEVTQGKMSLIDLAGSERATVTTNRGARLREGANINKSLLALGNCINALAANKDKTGHVPYRNSKLTRLLKDSLGGNCRTVMIANISPSGLSYDDTYNTLKYADRAKQIKTKLVRNVVNVDYHVTRYRTIVIELQKEITELKSKMTIPASASTSSLSYFDMGEASRLQCMVSDVYNERMNLRKNMADLDAIERDTLLRIFRKERDLQRVEVFTGNDTKLSKLQNKLEYLRGRLKDVKEQKTVVHQQLSYNNEGISRIQSEINTTLSLSDTSSSNALSKHMELTTEARKLEAECAHQWKQTKHLLRYIKNQEKEISRTEKVFSLALELVRKQYQLLQATNCITPVVKDLFDSLVRQIEGEKEVVWTDNKFHDSLQNVSVSSFTQTHQTLFDTIVKYTSPLRKTESMRYSSPTKSASLGILTCSGIERSQSSMSAPSPLPDNGSRSIHPLSTRRMAPPLTSPLISPGSSSSSIGGNLAGKVLNMPITSPRRKKRVAFTPPPTMVEETGEGFGKKEQQLEEGKMKESSSSFIQIKERKDGSKPLQTKISLPVPPPPRTQRSLSTSALTSYSVAMTMKDLPHTPSYQKAILSADHNNRTSPTAKGSRVNLAQLTSIANTPVAVGFEDNFVGPSSYKKTENLPSTSSHNVASPINQLPPPMVFPKVYCLTPTGQKLPIPATTPQSSRPPFQYPQIPYSNFSPAIGGGRHYKQPMGHLPSPKQSPINHSCKSSLTYYSPIQKVNPPDLTKSLPDTKSLSNPLYISHTVPPPPVILSPSKEAPHSTGHQLNEGAEDDSLENKLNSTFVISKGPKAGSHHVTGSSILKGKERKSTKQISHLKAPLSNSNDYQADTLSISSSSSVGEKKQPSYLSLTKSAANKRIHQSINNQPNRVQKENVPTRSHSVKSKHKVQLTVNRTATSRSQSVSTVA